MTHQLKQQRDLEKRKIQEAIYLSKREEVKQTKAVKSGLQNRRVEYLEQLS